MFQLSRGVAVLYCDRALLRRFSSKSSLLLNMSKEKTAEKRVCEITVCLKL